MGIPPNFLLEIIEQISIPLAIISADMKISEQCGIAASKGNQIIALIKRNIVYKEKDLIIRIYNSIVSPHLK